MSAEVEVAGNLYRIGSISAIKQFHIVRRLTPILKSMAVGGLKAPGAAGASDPLALFAPMADALAAVSNEDAEYIIFHCFKVVSRKQGNVWAPIQTQTPGADLMFSDIRWPDIVRLVVEVIKENRILDFFPGQEPGGSPPTPPAA